MANEKRLIDANALMKYINENHSYSGLPMASHILTMELLTYAPTVDAVEVVHGRWIYHECVSSHDGAISGYSCSECHGFVNEEMFDMDEFHKDFCGHCGAKMDG